MAVELQLLGEIDARIDGRPIDLGHSRQRCVLAALLVDANRVVPPDRLLDRVWGGQPPQRARNALSGYLSRLRAVFRGTGVEFVRQPGGYVVSVDASAVDLHRFRELCAQGRREPEPARRAAVFEEALALWRGDPFGSLDTPWIAGMRTALAAERLAVELDVADLGLAAGRHGALLGELTDRAERYPLDERIAGQLMRALAASGRQADAVDHYHRLRGRLGDELGLDPGPDLQRLFQQVLAGETAAAEAAPAKVVPRQLPAPPSAFTGRAHELAELDALLVAPGAPVAAVSGTAGVGKTTLALHWAHRVADRFPDGQLYVNLRGFAPDGSVLGPSGAVRGFLTALGVTASAVPSTVDEQAALYRSLVAGRRLLVVLDNARDAGHVRPLLPGAPGAVTVVTSRDQLGGLVAVDGARPVTLDLFSAAEARQLLGARLGSSRLAAEPAAADDIVTRCARLPLALSIVAARAAAHRRFSLADIAAELTGAEVTGLDPFDGGDRAADVRAVFSWSYRALPPDAARLFRLLGLHQLPEMAVAAVASLAGLPETGARRLLADLARANLVTETRPGRYTTHDLLRAYAVERATEEGDDRRAATRRLLDHLLHTAYAADRLIYPHRDPIVLADPDPAITPASIPDRDAATRWLRVEHDGLRAAVDWAHRAGFDRHAWELAWSLTSHFNLGGYWIEQIAVQRTALAAAERMGDGLARAHAHRNLGRACTQLGRLDGARRHLNRALSLFVAAGDSANHAQTYINLARVCEQQGLHEEALWYDERSLDMYRRAGHLTGQARALNNIACQRAHLGRYDEALTVCEEALRLNEELGNRHGAATNWQSLAYIHTVAGMPLAAVVDSGHALRLFQAVGDRAGEADTLVLLADAHIARGDRRAAVLTWRKVLPMLEEMRHPSADRVRSLLTGALEDPVAA